MDVKASFMTYLDQLKRSQSDPSLGKGNPAKAMSCEGCSQKFTVFKRKKLCNICLRYFCTHCLTPQLGPNGNSSVLARLTDRRHICATCVVLTARPLCRLQLKRLKVKDLQHYLTAQRVSTRGCVEKDDLVNLLIRHVGSTNSGSHQENVCNSHTDLSMGSESNTSNPLHDRPPVPPQFNRTNVNTTNASAPNSSTRRPQQSAAVRTTVTSSATTATTSSSSSSSSSRVAGRRPVISPVNSEEGFEIVELTEDWSDELDETGPEPVVEEISDSAGGTLSSPTSVGGDQNTLSSSTTSLGEPNVTSSSTSSPSHEQSHNSDSGSPSAPPTSSPPPPPPPAPSLPQSSSPPPPPAATSAAVEEEEEEELAMDTSEAAQTDPEATASNPDPHSVRPPIITLNTIKTLEELQSMPIKQIKELLARNRVDFRGCCERTELVERATRLWIENKEQKKALESLGPAEMCKICMDAPIECAMLECGHMATCLTCGIQLSECPLCRQYVVRVLRIFRA